MSSPFLVYNDAASIPHWIIDALKRHGHNANIILPQIEKSRRAAPEEEQIWIVYAPNQRVEYVLAVTEGMLDSYPIFIFTTNPVSTLAGATFNAQMKELAVKLRENVSDRRVYSVFAPKPITITFCGIWQNLTDIRQIGDYYDALISYCTPETLKRSQRGPTGHFDIRLAKKSDLHMVAGLCKGFADESPPFVLNQDDAEREAEYLIKDKCVWVYMIRESDTQDYEVASIVACTRNTERVAAITKVYTADHWRGRGCAGHLVRFVCEEMFRGGKKSIVLYVGTDNPARRVYDKVGFVGLGDGGNQVEGVDPWLERGFSREEVDFGHW